MHIKTTGKCSFQPICLSMLHSYKSHTDTSIAGGGTARFNPNLYADGKVCLSLLNTWAGQQWTPGQSTILQVLVSIQAMIFCDEPHCNEPGFEFEAGSEQSKEYNRNLYPMVIKYAMLEWLTGERNVTSARQHYNPLKPEDLNDPAVVERYRRPGATIDKSKIWSDVVKKHFQVKENEIVTTVATKWMNDRAHSPYSLRSRHGKGRTLAEADRGREKPKTSISGDPAAELSAKGDNLTARLRAALEEFPQSSRFPYVMEE